MKKYSSLGRILSGISGIMFLLIGTINTFWGNDMGFGIFIILLSILYFIPMNDILNRLTGRRFSVAIKLVLAIFILWAALGVGELFDKIDMMLHDIRSIIS